MYLIEIDINYTSFHFLSSSPFQLLCKIHPSALHSQAQFFLKPQFFDYYCYIYVCMYTQIHKHMKPAESNFVHGMNMVSGLGTNTILLMEQMRMPYIYLSIFL